MATACSGHAVPVPSVICPPKSCGRGTQESCESNLTGHGAGMQGRLQRTIRQSVETTGIGFLTGRDIHIRFQPAAVNQGIEFRRTDSPSSPPIPARIEF